MLRDRLSSLVPCQLPARKPLVVNDDWRRALDEVEAALVSCALQVSYCRTLQNDALPAVRVGVEYSQE